jgi:hypothetical protein
MKSTPGAQPVHHGLRRRQRAQWRQESLPVNHNKKLKSKRICQMSPEGRNGYQN